MKDDDLYLFGEVEDILKQIRKTKYGSLNVPKAFMCLCMKIRELEYEIDTLKAKVESQNP